MSVNPRYTNSTSSTPVYNQQFFIVQQALACFVEDLSLMEFMYLVFTCMPGESYRRWFRSLLLHLCYAFWALITSLVCWSLLLGWTTPSVTSSCVGFSYSHNPKHGQLTCTQSAVPRSYAQSSANVSGRSGQPHSAAVRVPCGRAGCPWAWPHSTPAVAPQTGDLQCPCQRTPVAHTAKTVF